VILEVVFAEGKPPNPFKLNLEWLKEENFVEKTKYSWIPFNDSLNELTPIQFHQILKNVKQMEIQWSMEKKEKDDINLREVKDILTSRLTKDGLVSLIET
jgi:hypothetical protein